MSRRRRSPVVAALVVALSAVSFASCSEDPTDVEMEVIEEVTFAPNLNINLADYTELPSGIYIRDLIVGGGPVLDFAAGDTAKVNYSVWLRTGARLEMSSLTFTQDLNLIEGWFLGMEGMAEGGRRWFIVPPELAWGAAGRPGVYPGAIIIFDITLTDVVELP